MMLLQKPIKKGVIALIPKTLPIITIWTNIFGFIPYCFFDYFGVRFSNRYLFMPFPHAARNGLFGAGAGNLGRLLLLASSLWFSNRFGFKLFVPG
jgi:hypothetical protein